MSVPRSRVVLAAGALALVAAACGGDGDSGATTTPTSPGATPAPTPTPTVHVVEVEVRDGEVVGGPQRVDVAVGEDVQITVTSDVADEVHVHGYDFTEDVAAGGERTMRFTADVPGVFEVELEERGLRLLTLEVR